MRLIVSWSMIVRASRLRNVKSNTSKLATEYFTSSNTAASVKSFLVTLSWIFDIAWLKSWHVVDLCVCKVRMSLVISCVLSLSRKLDYSRYSTQWIVVEQCVKIDSEVETKMSWRWSQLSWVMWWCLFLVEFVVVCGHSFFCSRMHHNSMPALFGIPALFSRAYFTCMDKPNQGCCALFFSFTQSHQHNSRTTMKLWKKSECNAFPCHQMT